MLKSGYSRTSVADQSRPWKLTASMHPQAVQKTWTIRNSYGYRYAKICISPTISLSNGRRLTGLCMIYEQDMERGFFCMCSPRGSTAGEAWYVCWCRRITSQLDDYVRRSEQVEDGAITSPAKKRNKILSIQNFRSTYLHGEVSKTCNKNHRGIVLHIRTICNTRA